MFNRLNAPSMRNGSIQVAMRSYQEGDVIVTIWKVHKGIGRPGIVMSQLIHQNFQQSATKEHHRCIGLDIMGRLLRHR